MLENLKEELRLKDKATIFHFYLFEKMAQKLEPNTNIMDRKIAKFILCRHTIPNQHHQVFLREMESCGLIKLTDKQNIELIGKNQELAKPIEQIAKEMFSKGMLKKDIATQLGVNNTRISHLTNKKDE